MLLHIGQGVLEFLGTHFIFGAAVRRLVESVENRPQPLPVQHLLAPATAERDVAELAFHVHI